MILAYDIPCTKVGSAFALTYAGMKRLRSAFQELDRKAEARGMRVAVAV